jgi:2-polyprenyl-6-hydroxyphenyl methylase / 3-demethylubiquinone-9 3-methyltransferase
VDQPARAIKEAARVLKPGGVVLFYTFNRTFLSRFLAIRAVKLITRDCPKNFHVWHLFIKPRELEGMAKDAGLPVRGYRGLRPRFMHTPFWSSVLRRKVHKGFAFQYTSSLALGYFAFAEKPLP